MNLPKLRFDLRRLAANHRWTWHIPTENLLSALPRAGPDRHPVGVVDELSAEDLETLSRDERFLEDVETISSQLRDLEDTPEPTIAYLSPEFGISALVPQYSGGLGVLAGDHLKASSDLGIPLIGVGLLYSHEVFHQEIHNGHQTESLPRFEPAAVGAVDTGIEVTVPMPGREVTTRVWALGVGGVRLFLLTTDVEENSEHDRNITDHLYLGTSHHRLEQEIILGVGGARALAEIGLDIRVHHLNEGHAGFAALELIDRSIQNGELSEAVETIRKGLVFTTHTPVPAGIDRFHTDEISPYLDIWAERWQVDRAEIWNLGVDPEDGHRFNMAAFCLRMSSSANGVSRLHGEVSRSMFEDVGIGSAIGHITNGVHARTWTSHQVQHMLDDAIGPLWSEGDLETWDRVDVIGDDRLAECRRTGALRLADLVKTSTGHKLDPDALILGFARRFAPYKRAALMFRHPDHLQALLTDEERPVHFIFSGKAHPADQPGKALVAEVASFAESGQSRSRFTFLPDYDMNIAGLMVQGCDVWLNNPIRPREASGTSGEKVVLNGGLNCSILDGWWAEMFDGRNGWSVPASSHEDPALRDSEESAALLDTIGLIAQEYHHGRPIFHGRIRHAWRTLGPLVTAARMARDYDDQIYQPALGRAFNPTP
ncbi:MAG: alpha-glucan family phosphorylase [Acidimicrobiia bacterium]|nr:alpha-glucan family phosphorylase [Acidimicrobiia bacterium]